MHFRTTIKQLKDSSKSPDFKAQGEIPLKAGCELLHILASTWLIYKLDCCRREHIR